MAWLREFGRVIYESTELKGPGYRVRSTLLGRQSWPGTLSSCSTRFPTESGSTIPGQAGSRTARRSRRTGSRALRGSQDGEPTRD